MVGCVQIEIQQLNFRLSYNDIKLFLAIAQSLPSLDKKKENRDSHRSHGDGKEMDGKGNLGMHGTCTLTYSVQ